MKIERINLYQVKLEFKKPFTASWGSFKERYPTLVEIQSEGLSGWGEAAALPYPYYGHEDSYSVYHVLKDYLCQMVIRAQPQTVEELNTILSKIKLNNIAKSGIEMAFWDLTAKRQAMPLYKLMGGIKNQIGCGATLPSDLPLIELIDRTKNLLNAGYKKVRVKLGRHTAISDLQQLLTETDSRKIAFDANGCFNLQDLDYLRALDRLGVLYIEQPLPADDLIANAELQSKMQTPICLDESINTFNQAQLAIRLGSAKAFSIKSARMGGHHELLRIYEACSLAGISLIAGGMFESGIGRAHALAVASLENCRLPAALSESAYYYEKDLIFPEFSFDQPGILSIPEKPGIGVSPDLECINRYLIAHSES